MESKTKIPYFLKGGSEMGNLIRAKDWSKTPIGDPLNWPQSLQTMVSVMLENPFGMYIAWGKEYTQIYNDGYRPILGTTKHPDALGSSTKQTFSEIWDIIGSMFDDVMRGKSVSFSDFMLPLDRNGYVENCCFDFAYSPIRLENGEVGGVLVTVTETTHKKKVDEAILDSKNQLEFAIEATQLGTFDYNPITNTFTANNRVKEWFGLSNVDEINLTDAMKAIAAADRERVINALMSVLHSNSGEILDLEYSIINPNTNKQITVHAKGKVWFNDEHIAYRLNGTLEDVTEKVVAREKIKENEQNLRLMILQAPMAIAILRGHDYKVEIANKFALELWGRTEEQVIELPLFEAMPELSTQGIKVFLDDVVKTRNRFATQEMPVQIKRNNVLETVYINFSFDALYDFEGNVNGIMAIGFDVTAQVAARIKVEESEQSIRALVESAPFPIGVYVGKELRIALANQSIMDAWGKGNDVVGKLYTEILPELENQQIFEQLQGVLSSGIAFHAKNQRVDLLIDNQLRAYYFNYSFTPLFDSTGNVYAVMNTAAEVTELHEAKQKVEESEKRFRDSVAQAPLGIAIFRGKDFITEMANKNYLLLVDRKEEEFIGKPLFDALPEVKDLVEPLFHEVIRSGEPFYSPELPATLNRYGKMEQAYFNLVYHPLKEDNGEISGIMVVATEVTNTVNAKHLLEESETHFRTMVMQSPIPMTILRGSNYIIESANKVMYENIWRKKESDILGRSIIDVFPELKEQKYPELLHKVYSTGICHTEKESEAFVMGDDGMKKFYLDFEYKALYGPDEKVSGIMITVNDVTDRVEARLRIEQNEERLNVVIDASELGVWELNVKTKETISSKRCQEIFGVFEEEYVPHTELLRHIHPDDVEPREKSYELAYQTGILHYEIRINWEDGSTHWIETKGKVFYDTENKPDRILGTKRDITQEKQFQQQLLEREEKFRLLADSMPQHVWTADPEGNLNYFNQSIIDFSGMSLEEIEKKGWLDIVHPDDRPLNIHEWTTSIQTGKDFLLEHRFRKYNGEYRWQLSRAIPQRDKDGKITMWVGTSTDIQDQKMFAYELEKQVTERTKELHQKNTDLEKMNKELQSFAYISSHDLQEPLRKIQTFASLLNEKEHKNLSDSGKDKFHRMQKAANRMQTLIQDLLAYSRTNTQERIFERTNLKNIIDEVKEDLSEEISKKKGTIEIGQMCDVKVIPFQFRQLLFNLVSNALKFAKDNHPPIIRIDGEIGLGSKFKNKKLVKDATYCHIQFTDNGIGFEQEYSEKIFVVFQRLHGKEEYNGTGIGLAIVKKIIENHKGVIVAKGELNKGATFDIYIPS
ncbi:PAS domain-containing protein [uncultured Flavobacterium sp.]|uniref:PAS domain-containing protein n=1 Tax=uncultured Flavobacterium sp. TaxID=165435 RepID=UPI0030C88D17